MTKNKIVCAILLRIIKRFIKAKNKFWVYRHFKWSWKFPRPFPRLGCLTPFLAKNYQTFQRLGNFSNKYDNLCHKFLFLSINGVSSHFIATLLLQNIAQNAYCSRDIYFQFKSVCRSVISSVIIHRRLKRASIIGCHERTTMLISMMEVTNRTMDTAR